ncbi:MAG: tetratricopeptide repeat protein [Burkholderiales bacterium]
MSAGPAEATGPAPGRAGTPRDVLQQAFDSYQRGDLKAARGLLQGLVQMRPGHFDVLHLLGVVCRRLGALEEGLRWLDQAVVVQPDHAMLHNNRGNVLSELNRLPEALESYDRALALDPTLTNALAGRGSVLVRLGRGKEAVASFDEVLRREPQRAIAYRDRGMAFKSIRRYEEAARSFTEALRLDPNMDFLIGERVRSLTLTCDWAGLGEIVAACEQAVAAGRRAVQPFNFVAISDRPDLHREAATAWAEARCPRDDALGPPPVRPADGKIRIGYYSADFHDHATAFLMAELFEAHDRDRFECYAFSFGSHSKDAMRKRLTAAFDRFIDVSRKSDVEVARMSRQLGIDIAVDLKGYTQDCRTGIFALRCAPVQVNYLGFPGTMGVDYIDYIVADRTVVPEEDREHYTERVVYLPHSYQVNDAHRKIADRSVTRADMGLPDQGFVFCCFNNNYKILPETFDSWMRILGGVDGSVLWLLEDNPAAAHNLRKAAAVCGIDPGRLVFAQRARLPDHLARQGLADLFLDTVPYNAHTTASDALWAGVPLLTLMGRSFPARVAASLLRAVGLPDLVAESWQDYEALAIGLAGDPERLAALRQRLAEQRKVSPLFDGRYFARHLEAAFCEMYHCLQAGESPEHIDIAALDRSVAVRDSRALYQEAARLDRSGKLPDAKRLCLQVVRDGAAPPIIRLAAANLLVRYGQQQLALEAGLAAFEELGSPIEHAPNLIYIAQRVAHWPTVTRLTEKLREAYRKGQISRINESPRTNLLWCDDESINLAVVGQWSATSLRNIVAGRPPVEPGFGTSRRIRVGYLSSDFREHPTSRLVNGLFRHHDHKQFEVFMYCSGWDDGSPMRREVESHMDHVHSLAGLTDEEAASLIRGHGIDVLVELNGPTRANRMGLLAFRPAPVQIDYLGWPGSVGGRVVDYVVGDPHTVPDGAEKAYPERVIRINHTYQVNDYAAMPRPPALTLEEAGLKLEPGQVVVGMFNAINKVHAEVWAVWMRILKAAPHAMLWLLDPGEEARRNLALACRAHGVPVNRIRAAPALSNDKHLARIQLCDLMLDPWPYGGHTSTSDALFAGVPVLALEGRNFAGRVSGGLLRAAGLEALVQPDVESYMRLAVRLLNDRAELARIKTHVRGKVPGREVFNAHGRARELESAYRCALELAARGEAPKHITLLKSQPTVKARKQPKRIAVVTAYYNEPYDILKRCIDSVAAQTVPVNHYVVCDGEGLAELRGRDDIRHVALGVKHGDFGDTPRGMGAAMALREGSDALAFLDADNVFAANHLELLLSSLEGTDAEVAVATRYFMREDGTTLNPRVDDGDHVDTSSFLLTGSAVELGRIWLEVPKQMSCIGDKAFWKAVTKKAKIAPRCALPTLGYTTLWPLHYKQMGEAPPVKNARFIRNLVQDMNAWIKELTPAEKRKYQRFF